MQLFCLGNDVLYHTKHIEASTKQPSFAGKLWWRNNGRDSVSNHQPHDCLLNRLFRCRSNKTSKLRVTDLCAENSPGTVEFPAQMASNAENVSIWWRHHVLLDTYPQPFLIRRCCSSKWRLDMTTLSDLFFFLWVVSNGNQWSPLIKGQ